MRLKDKVAIITGSGSGIGRGIALEFARQGAKIVVSGRKLEPLNETVSQIKKAGGQAFAVAADVSIQDQVKNLVDSAIDKYGKVDILVNNAGVYIAHDALGLSEEEWNTTMDIDVKGLWLCSKNVLPQMLSQGKGKIINIASIAGLMGFEQSAAYCAAKGAVVNLTREMALDYAKRGININAIAPGIIESDMTKDFLADENARKSFLEKTPVGRVGQPQDIAFGAVYLASDESDFVSGHILVIDGGWTIK